jgi:3-oxoacyl-[acyl-carrier-protein] synthase-3
MDGFKVFSFVAAKVKPMLAQFIAESGPFDRFVPHQANMYMLRQLAKGLGVESKMLLSGEEYGNVGSASIPLTLAAAAAKEDLRSKRVLLAGFGAGFSAAAAAVSLSDTFSAKVLV